MIRGSVVSGGRAKSVSPGSPWEELEFFRERLVPVRETEDVSLSDALGRVTSEALSARRHVPDGDLAGAAGYALWLADLSFDTPSTLRVVGEARVGHPFMGQHDENCAVRVDCDALVPEGADVVVAEADCQVSADGQSIELPIHLSARMRAGENVRRRGADVRAGDILAGAGRWLRPQDVALIATQGPGSVRVRRRLRIGIASVGTATVELDAKGVGRRVTNSASMGAIGVLRQLNCEVEDFGCSPESAERLAEFIARAEASQDVLIVVGGTSTQAIEPVRAALHAVGGNELGQFSTRPVTVGQVGACTVLGISGPGASMLVSLVLFVRPLLLRRMGAAEQAVVHFPVRAGFEFSRRPGRPEWLYARLEADPDSGPIARVFRTGSADRLGAMIAADGLVELPDDCSRVAPGDRVNYLPLDLLIAA